MYTGSFNNSIDGKNRMIVPAKYRNQLGGHCMLTRGFDRCLYIYSMEEFEELVEQFKNLKQSDKRVRIFIREFFSNTEECNLDSQGRILIPQNLREYAGINKELVTKGAMDHIEVWSVENLESANDENTLTDEEFAEMRNTFDF